MEARELIEEIAGVRLTCTKPNKTVIRNSVERSIKNSLTWFLIASLVACCVCIIAPSYTLFCIFVLCFVIYGLTGVVKKETVLLVFPIGIQIDSLYILGNESNTFIPWTNIDEFSIVEVISRQTVIYSLVVFTKNFTDSYVTLFERTKPRLPVLEKVYRNLQMVLLEHRQKSECK